MKHYMNTYNAHNKELVEKINEVCNNEDYLPIVIIAVRAICETCKAECMERFGFTPYYADDILKHLSDILMNLCDDTDLEIILKFCRKL